MSIASDMITALETFLATNVGVGEIVVDGQRIKFDRSQAMAELKYWKTEYAKETGQKKIVRQINLGGMW